MTATSHTGTGQPPPPRLDLDDRIRIVSTVVQHRIGGTTPARFRLWSIAAIVAMALVTTTASWAARVLVDSTDRARDNTAPVLVATQDVFASIAEADAASASVFLSGVVEDPQQRRLYEQALERSVAQVEQVARLVGDDAAAHESLKSIAINLTVYSGLVEAARTANQNRLPTASASLLEAITVVQGGIVPEVEALTAGAQDDFEHDRDGGTAAAIVALVLVGLTVIVLVGGQRYIRLRTRRLFNLPLLVATLLIVVAGLWLASAWLRQQDALNDADVGGYDSIALTSEIQTSAFRYKTLESLSLLGVSSAGEQADLDIELASIEIDEALVASAYGGEVRGDGLLLRANRNADSIREQAATAELLVRWARYRQTSDDIRIAIQNADRPAAVELATGAGNTDFNGFNTAVESVLSDNRTQFLDGVANARSHLDWLQVAMVLLPALGAVLALWGFQIRINEYRR